MRPIALAACLLACPAVAAEFSPPSRIDLVTVFPDGARITRRLEVEVPAGAHAVIIKGLPANVDPNSIRIEGEGSSALAIGSLDLKRVPGEVRPAVDTDLEKKLRALIDQRDALRDTIVAVEARRDMIQRYARAEIVAAGPDRKPLPVEEWGKAWEAVGVGLKAVNAEWRKLSIEFRDLAAEIVALENARPRPAPPGQPRVEVTIAVEAAAAFKGRLTLHYRVGGAAWSAAYDARLATGTADAGPKLEMVRRALVTQRTGEEWTDVELSVSTARTAGATAAPTINPLQVSYLEFSPPPVAAPLTRNRAFNAPAPGAAPAAPPPAAPAELADAAKPKVVAEERAATVEATAFEATFRIPGRVTVPTDGSSKTFRIGGREIEPKLVVRTSPALDTAAYLTVEAENAEDAALLPGPVTLTRDGNFVGNARLAFTAPGDRFDFGFGADERVKVTRVPVLRRENDPASPAGNRTDQRDFRTTVENLHVRPVTVTVTDQIPFSEITTLTVEQLGVTTPPTDKAVDARRGVLSWTYTLKPKEKKEIRLAWRLRYPADRELVFTSRPVPGGR